MNDEKSIANCFDTINLVKNSYSSNLGV